MEVESTYGGWTNTYTPRGFNEPKNEGFADESPFQKGDFQVEQKNLTLLQVRERIKLNFQTNKQEITAGD